MATVQALTFLLLLWDKGVGGGAQRFSSWSRDLYLVTDINVLLFNNAIRCDTCGLFWWTWCVKNNFKEILHIRYNCPTGVTDELVSFWWPNVKDTVICCASNFVVNVTFEQSFDGVMSLGMYIIYNLTWFPLHTISRTKKCHRAELCYLNILLWKQFLLHVSRKKFNILATCKKIKAITFLLLQRLRVWSHHNASMCFSLHNRWVGLTTEHNTKCARELRQ